MQVTSQHFARLPLIMSLQYHLIYISLLWFSFDNYDKLFLISFLIHGSYIINLVMKETLANLSLGSGAPFGSRNPILSLSFNSIFIP